MMTPRGMVRETFDLRIPEGKASEWLSPNDGTSLGGSVRKLLVRRDEPVVDVVREAQRHYRSLGSAFYLAWSVFRKYSKAELANAAAFMLKPHPVEMAGEEYGTTYDEYVSCPLCGTGALQTSPLTLACRRLPRKDFCRSLGWELIVSARVVRAFVDAGVTGVEFAPIICSETGVASENWRQLVVSRHDVHIASPTEVGIGPFEEVSALTEKYECARGHLLGLNIISEASIDRNTWGDEDIAFSDQFIGIRRGLIRPHRVLFISPKVRAIIANENLTGTGLEVVHVV